ncbi:MAG: cell division protein FtsZ [bacterium]|nr:cell division protein FtsZ [bacterium]
MSNTTISVQVVGIGGGGGNAVDHIARAHRGNNVTYAAINTDVQALNALQIAQKIQIGAQLTGGHGSGARPEIGRQAAEEDYPRLRELFQASHLVFLAAGLGGGTGTGATPVVAKAAKERGALTIAVVTRPFAFEGARRAEIAEQGLIELRHAVDTIICIPNDRVIKLADENIGIEAAFRMTDEVLRQAVDAVSELVARVGIINIDYGDIATVLREPGDAMVGFGEAAGENHATKAARYALTSPLLERNNIAGAKQVLISIAAGRDLKMRDVQEAIQCVHNEVRGNAHVIFGVTLHEDMSNMARVTLIATGLPDAAAVEHGRPRPVVPAAFKPLQTTMDFMPAETGRFSGLEPTLLSGVNYDTPTFMRWGRKLLSDAA